MNRRSVVALALGGMVIPFTGFAQETRRAEAMVIATSGGIRLATEAFGSRSDPALLLVMGATASMLGWPDNFCQTLASRGFYVLRFDHRDTGFSTTVAPGAAEYTVEDMAADVMAVLDNYGIERAHLMGMSLGGYICQILALTNPDRIRSITLLASEPLGWDGAPLPYISEAFLEHFSGLGSLDWNDAAAVMDFLVGIDRLSASPNAAFDASAARDRISAVLHRTESPASMFNHAGVTTREDWSGCSATSPCQLW